MSISFDPTGGTAPVNVKNELGFTPTGLRFKVKAGPTNPVGQKFVFALTMDAPQNTCGGCEWQLEVSPTNSWVTVSAPFPADGTIGTSVTPG
jgi:hypothetical protein